MPNKGITRGLRTPNPAVRTPDGQTKARIGLSILSASLFLTACAHTAPTALIPVATSCIPKNLKPADHYETPESLKALKDGDWLKAVVDDWMARIQRMSVTEPVIEACAALP